MGSGKSRLFSRLGPNRDGTGRGFGDFGVWHWNLKGDSDAKVLGRNKGEPQLVFCFKQIILGVLKLNKREKYLCD